MSATEAQRQQFEDDMRKLAELPEDPNWAEGLSEAPPIPTSGDESTAILIKTNKPISE